MSIRYSEGSINLDVQRFETVPAKVEIDYENDDEYATDVSCGSWFSIL